jgi:hypothetical protein
MKTSKNCIRAIFRGGVIGFCIAAAAVTVSAQQRNDPQFDTKIARPAHTKKHPRVLIDAAHKNAFSVQTNRIEPLIQLMRNDGLTVDIGKDAFSAAGLDPYHLLVVLTARGNNEPTDPAFTADEIDAVYTWVNKGGSMLFCMDHTPFAESGRKLAERFGVNVILGYVADPARSDRWHDDDLTPVYTRTNNGLGNNALIRGRNGSEEADKVATFGGMSFSGPKTSWNLFRVSSSAFNGTTNSKPGEGLGLSQAIALKSGKGRIVITGDCSMWTAQLVTFNDKEYHYGMARTDLGNRQFAINVIRWLTGAIR